jgi:hypothetical protein
MFHVFSLCRCNPFWITDMVLSYSPFRSQTEKAPAFNRSIGKGWGFGDLAVPVAFRFNEGMILELSRTLLLSAHATLVFLPRGVWQMGDPKNADWTVGCSVMIAFHLAYK